MAERGGFADGRVIVTGGAGGIGTAICRRFAAAGADVIVADRRAAAAEETAHGIKMRGGTATAWPVDVADAAAVGKMFTTLGESRSDLQVLVNCAGHANDTAFERLSAAEFDEDMTVTLKAAFFCIQAALPMLLRSPNGPNVVSIGSVNGIAAFGNEAYSAAKAGLTNLTKNLAIRYGPRGVRFNVVAPGTVRSPIWDAPLAAEPGLLDRVKSLYPLRRVGTPDDIAAACVFLASPEASWITGQTLAVDGGITAGHSDLIGTVFGADFFTGGAGTRPEA